ncbi:MAG TPA: SRPBCC domain-containing protein [Thermoanaerobaculia bacterium]|nr:SRPBCC domain-containing protein [Thermoanaerobaculia bacterium]
MRPSEPVPGQGFPDILEISREVRAAPERVFRAFTTPEDLKDWWGKGEWSMTAASVDLRPGGSWRLDFRHPQTGQTATVSGEYRTIDPPRRLSMIWSNSLYPDFPNSVELTLEPSSAGTRLTLRHSGLSARPDAYQDYEQGWAGVLAQLIVWAMALTAAFAAGPISDQGS